MLQEDSAASFAKQAGRLILVYARGDHQNFSSKARRSRQSQKGFRLALAKINIQEHNINWRPPGDVNAVVDRIGLPDDLEIGLRREQSSVAFADQDVVTDQQYASQFSH